MPPPIRPKPAQAARRPTLPLRRRNVLQRLVQSCRPAGNSSRRLLLEHIPQQRITVKQKIQENENSLFHDR